MARKPPSPPPLSANAQRKPTKAAAKAKPKPKRKPGQPKRGPLPWRATDAEVAKIRLYAGLGSTQEHIATMIGKCLDTIRKDPRCVEALDQGKAETIAKVAGTLVSKALKGDTTSAIFYLKTQAGWRETVRNEHTGANGGPIEYANLSDEEIEARIAALEAPHAGRDATTH